MCPGGAELDDRPLDMRIKTGKDTMVDDDNPTVPVAELGDGIGVEGTVLSTKWDLFTKGRLRVRQLKMLILVQTPEGEYRLWGPVPKALDGINVGEMITMVADVTESGKSPDFGYFHNPRSAEVIDRLSGV